MEEEELKMNLNVRVSNGRNNCLLSYFCYSVIQCYLFCIIIVFSFSSFAHRYSKRSRFYLFHSSNFMQREMTVLSLFYGVLCECVDLACYHDLNVTRQKKKGESNPLLLLDVFFKTSSKNHFLS